jgi:glycosyltransferase involved in cell wall biosynthesis
MMDAPFRWDRFWFPGGSQISLRDGYLPDPEDLMGLHLNAQGVPIEALKNVPCLVLLGVPGMGKTSEMEKAADLARQNGELVDFISLARMTGPSSLDSQLVEGAHQANWRSEGRVWNVFLDGLDEALAQLTQIEKAVADAFRRLAEKHGSLNHLRVRISCRSAEWPQSLEAELRTVWNDEDVRVYELGHLRRKDVKLAVAQLFPSEPQQQQFMEYVQEHEAEPLASRPITLNMLLNVFRQDAVLPTQQVQLYRKGLLAFIEEANQTRRLNRQTWRLDVRSKLMVAARLAASTVFSNSSEIWTGHQSQVPPARAIVLSEIAGGYEPSLSSSFPVGEAELREVLLTSLFVPIGTDLYGWSHQTFAEFLAAYYVTQHDLSPDETIEFLNGSGNTKSQIPPQLTEVAAWLASMQPEFFRTLVRLEPAILLRSDVAAAAPDDREALVSELLQRFDREELHDFHRDVRFRYERFHHPRLGEQLKPYISDKTKNRIVRRVAIDIAESNNLAELASLLSDVALDIADDVHIRSQAASAVSKIAPADVRLRLKLLAEESHPEDIDDDLKGYALRALWPRQLSVRELLSALAPPKTTNYFGAYAFFLSQLEVPELSASDAIAAIDWCADALQQDKTHQTFDRAAPRFLARAFEASNNVGVRERLADFLLGAIRDDAYSDEIQKSFSSSVLSDDVLRHELILSILRRSASDTERDYFALLGGSVPLLAKDDLPWLVELLASEWQEATRTSLVNLIVSQTFSLKLDDLSFVWDAAAGSRELSEALQRAYSVDLSSSVAKWQRDDHERKNRRVAEEQEKPFEFAQRIETDLSKIEANGSFEWWRLNLILLAQPNGRIDEFHSDLTKSTGWAALSDSQRRRVVLTANRYLNENFVRSSPWIGTHSFHRPAAAGYRAVRLIFSEDHNLFLQLDKNVWRKWAASIIGVSFNDDQEAREVRTQMFQRCYELAPTQVLSVIQRLLSKADSAFDVKNLLGLVGKSFDEKLGNLLWRFLGQTSAGEAPKPIIRYLVQIGYAPAVQLTVDLFNRADPAVGSQIPGTEEFVVAAAALIQRDANSVWSYFCNLRDRDERLAIQILGSIEGVNSYGDAEFYRDLSETQLADFYVWLYRHIPAPNEERNGEAHYLGFEHHIDQLRTSILRNLIGRGTPASVAGVQEIASKLPEATWLRWQVVDARQELAAKSWKRLNPAEVIAAISSYRPMPVVRSTKEVIKAAAIALENATQVQPEDVLPPSLETVPPTISLPRPPPTAKAAVKPRRVMTVATEWSSGHGGLSTLNRELCTALAAAGHSVVCLVVDPTPREIDEAAAAKVRLLGCPADPAISGRSRLLLFNPSQLTDYTPEIIIGHDHITGSAAQHIAQRLYDIPNVHFIHSLPEEIEIHKSRGGNSVLRGAEKASVQYQQCVKAQLVVGVGPRIHREISTRIAPNSDVPVAVMRPGLRKNLLAYQVDLAKPRSSHCLFIGRFEDGDLKGAGLACQMILTLNTHWSWQPATRPRLVMRGFDPSPEMFEKEIAAIGDFREAIQYLIPRPYTADAETIASDIRSASAVIMPSKREGFGLTALEGIAAGIPILVSAESGLGELLFERDIAAAIGQAVAEECVADVDGEVEEIRKDWATRVQTIFTDPVKAFSQAKQMRAALVPLLSWERAAEQFSLDMENIL